MPSWRVRSKKTLLLLVPDACCTNASGWRVHSPAHNQAYRCDRTQIDGYNDEYSRMGAHRRARLGPSAPWVWWRLPVRVSWHTNRYPELVLDDRNPVRRCVVKLIEVRPCLPFAHDSISPVSSIPILRAHYVSILMGRTSRHDRICSLAIKREFARLVKL